MEKFTKELCELYVNKKMSLEESLRILIHSKSKNVGKTAAFIIHSLEKGIGFSNSLKICPYVQFDDVYISFIGMAEMSGDLRSILEYLNTKIKRKQETSNKVFLASIYPCFVILLSFILCVSLTYIWNMNIPKEVYRDFVILVIMCVFLFFVIRRILGTNKLYEAFLGTNLLVKNGIPISTAISCGAVIAGEKSKFGKCFYETGEKIEFGMDLLTAFSFSKVLKDDFFLAVYKEDEKHVFEQIVTALEEKDQRRKNICLLFIEPVFILVTGFFIISVILKFFLPVINNVDWMLF